MQVDIADESSVQVMVEETSRALGGIDILVNNAALMVWIVETPALEYPRAVEEKS